MALSETLVKMSPVKGEYYLVEREKIDYLYRNAGHSDEDEVPNFITIDGKECLFTENFIEKDGKEYEIVMVANGFSWEDIIIYDEDE
ncbi:hypothetical protein [Silvanigrella aquatica]|uniref:Uncharacterized protein n=1 Tax=Silvanigrella aquatica TaxID=1915309 RepID=A0A1L4D3X8_9BACT|nr:hypothetical protein [Silvanigrella aquatica]APJ04913.1 hypothetical protein AXG55_13825 [Silvanigrella aquatica]